MKTASVMSSLSRNSGGLFESVRRLHQCLAEIPGVDVTVLGLRDEFTEADQAVWSPLNVKAFPMCWPQQLGYAPGMKQALFELDEEIIHTHGIWRYPSILARDWHRRTGRPYLISPHGMLDPWAVKNSAWKKKLAQIFYEREHLEHAACIRALCKSEADSIRVFGLKNPICIIPNGIDLALSVEGSELRLDGSSVHRLAEIQKHRKVLLYLGRIHPKKGLVNLLRAWKQTLNSQPSTNDWLLAIAGWDQGGHEAELKRLASELGIPWADVRESKAPHPGPLPSAEREGHTQLSTLNSQPAASLLFLGPQFNEAKTACYQNCDAFILPSFSEGLPMVVLEAWAHGKPVLMTPECNLPEGFEANAAIRIETNIESIAQGLRELFRLPHSECTSPLRPEELPFSASDGEKVAVGRMRRDPSEVSSLVPCSKLSAMGMRGRQLVAERFTWPKIASELKSVYDWVLGGGAKPECVIES
jgi:poly(glycerol-phosphate) alpha-glucosyltransferase